MTNRKALVGVFGGSGLYSLIKDMEYVKMDTPYGPPSDKIALADIAGRPVAFLPRHGRDHSIPPHQINYRANLWVMKELGVQHILAPCAVGSLQPQLVPGDFVICDQFVDRTSGRIDTFFDGPVTAHVSAADPYCPALRQLALAKADKLGLKVHPCGTVVVIQGPRFSSRAESKWFNQMKWDVVNMTQYPEVILARELGICYVNISLITDYDVGVEGQPDVKPVTHEQVLRVFQENTGKMRSLLLSMIEELNDERPCHCSEAPAQARME